MEKEYLGDSVYVESDGYDLVLTTENGLGPTNTIVLEPSVYKRLVRYVEERVQEELRSAGESL